MILNFGMKVEKKLTFVINNKPLSESWQAKLSLQR